MSLKLHIQPACPQSPLVLAIMMGATCDHAIPGAAVVVDDAPPSNASVEEAAAYVARARLEAGAPATMTPHDGPLIVIAWSRACEMLRALLAAGIEIAAVIALDGTSGDYPHPTAAQLQPWRDVATRARAGEVFAAITATPQRYMVHPSINTDGTTHPPYAPTSFVLACIWDAGPFDPTGGNVLAEGPYEANGLRVEQHPGNPAGDAAAHIREQHEHGPRLLALAGEWLAGRARDTLPSAAPDVGTP